MDHNIDVLALFLSARDKGNEHVLDDLPRPEASSSTPVSSGYRSARLPNSTMNPSPSRSLFRSASTAHSDEPGHIGRIRDFSIISDRTPGFGRASTDGNVAIPPSESFLAKRLRKAGVDSRDISGTTETNALNPLAPRPLRLNLFRRRATRSRSSTIASTPVPGPLQISVSEPTAAAPFSNLDTNTSQMAMPPSPLSPLSPQLSAEELEFHRSQGRLAKLQRTLGENVPASLVLKPSRGSLKLESQTSATTQDDMVTTIASEKQMMHHGRSRSVTWSRPGLPTLRTKKAALRDSSPPPNSVMMDRSATTPLPFTPKEKISNVRRAFKMNQLFDRTPPSVLYQSSSGFSSPGGQSDAEMDAGDSIPAAEKSVRRLSPREESALALEGMRNSSLIRDEDVDSSEDDEPGSPTQVFGAPLPISSSSMSPDLFQPYKPYISTLSEPIPLATPYDQPFRHYGSRKPESAPNPPISRSRSHTIRPLTTQSRPLPRTQSFDYDKLPLRRPQSTDPRPSQMLLKDVNSPRSHSSLSTYRSPTSMPGENHDINSAPTSDDASFQARRKRAAKLSRFFGVSYAELKVKPRAFDLDDADVVSRASTSTSASTGSKKALVASRPTSRNSSGPSSGPVRSSSSSSRPSSPYESWVWPSDNNKRRSTQAGSAASPKFDMIVNGQSRPQDMKVALQRLRQIR